MNIYHNNKCIASNVIHADSFLSQARGLMFKKPLKQDTAVTFNLKIVKDVDVHMLFVFFNIDVVFLDSENIVIKAHTLKSFTGTAKAENVKTVLELSEGTIERYKIKTGDRITLN